MKQSVPVEIWGLVHQLATKAELYVSRDQAEDALARATSAAPDLAPFLRVEPLELELIVDSPN